MPDGRVVLIVSDEAMAALWRLLVGHMLGGGAGEIAPRLTGRIVDGVRGQTAYVFEGTGLPLKREGDPPQHLYVDTAMVEAIAARLARV